MSEAAQTVEVPEAEVKTDEARPTMTVSEAKGNGWGAKEIESGLKRKMLVEEEKKEEKPAPVEPKPDEAKSEDKRPESRRSSIPDFTMTPEQEKVFLDTFGAGTPPRAMYFRMKNERQARQASEARIRELEARLDEMSKAKPNSQPVLDEDGNEIDPDDKPLTMKQLRELEKQRQEEFAKQQKEQGERAARVTEAQRDQEDYARGIYPDFDETVTLAKDVISNLESIVPEKWKQEKVRRLFENLQDMAAKADSYSLDDYNPAMVAYEIGQFHPKYGKHAEKAQDGKQPLVDPKANGGLTPEQMERAAKNTQRKPSSASIAGGNGRRAVTAEEVTPEDLNRMNYKERAKFKADFPKRYAELVRG